MALSGDSLAVVCRPEPTLVTGLQPYSGYSETTLPCFQEETVPPADTMVF